MTKTREYEIEFERYVFFGFEPEDAEWEEYLATVEVSGRWVRPSLYDPGDSPEVFVRSVDGRYDFELTKKELERITEKALELYARDDEQEDY